MSRRGSEGTPQIEDLRREEMLTPDEVAAMLGLRGLGWGAKRIAAEFGCSRNTVKRYLGLGGWARCRRPERAKALDGLADWLSERFRQHRGNADVVRQELLAVHGIAVSLRTVERAVAPLRRELAAEARATVRFETPPGRQMQVDFGEKRVVIGGETIRVYLFVATLGHSRRLHVRAFRHERQACWFEGLESAFRRFGGVPEEVLARQHPGAGDAPRQPDSRGPLQCPAAGVRQTLEVPATGMCAVPGAGARGRTSAASVT